MPAIEVNVGVTSILSNGAVMFTDKLQPSLLLALHAHTCMLAFLKPQELPL